MVNALHHVPADLLFPCIQLQMAQPVPHLSDPGCAHLRDVQIPQTRGQRLVTQPLTGTRFTHPVAFPAAEKHTQVHFVLSLFQPGDESVQTSELAFGNTLNNHFQVPLFQLSKRYIDGQIKVLCKVQQLLQLVSIGGRIPRSDCAVPQRLVWIGYHEIHVNVVNIPESFTGGTGSQRAVKTE